MALTVCILLLILNKLHFSESMTIIFQSNMSVAAVALFTGRNFSTDGLGLKIIPEKELIVEAGDDFEIICQGNQANIRFDTPYIPTLYEEYTKWTNKEDKSQKIRDNDYLFSKKLKMRNVTGFHTGFYSCSYLYDTKTEIYVYVKDPKNICFINDNLRIKKIKTYTEGVIPCKATSPDVSMELYTISKNLKNQKKKILLNAIDEDGSIYTYDKDAFKTDDTKTTQITEYLCKCKTKTYSAYLRYWLEIEELDPLIPKPTIRVVNDYIATGQSLILECTVKTYGKKLSFKWKTPNNSSHPKFVQVVTNSTSNAISHRLIINEATLRDQGVYYCCINEEVEYNVNYINVKIYDSNVHFIKLKRTNFSYNIDSSRGEIFAQWLIKFEGFPRPTLIWIKNGNETIPSPKIYTKITSNEAILKITNISNSDFNTSYTLEAKNNFTKKSLTLFVNETGKPSAEIEVSERHLQWGTVKCRVVASPKPKITWYFKACVACRYQIIEEEVSEDLGYITDSYVEVNSTVNGFLKCHAKNTLGEVEVLQQILSGDVENLQISGFDNTTVFATESSKKVEAVIGETVQLACDSKFVNDKFQPEVQWSTALNLVFGVPIELYYKLEKKDCLFRIRTTLTILHAGRFDNNIPSCEVSKLESSIFLKEFVQVVVADGSEPKIIEKDSKMDKNLTSNLDQNISLHCYTTGYPTPIIEWFKDNTAINQSEGYQLLQKNHTLLVENFTSEDKGTYTCRAFNKFGIDQMDVALTLNVISGSTPSWAVVLLALLIVVTLLFVYIIVKKRAQNKFQEELNLVNLENFEKGAIEHLNPQSTIDEQANLLPYDSKWEFPIENLKLGKQLGSGAFGVVLKADAKGIVADEASTTVAVKMISKEVDFKCFEALASELKIMVHLGKHINIVNLLGACTRNIFKKKLYVIVEYCPFGNLQQYLMRHQENFIDQLDATTGWFDFSVEPEVSKDGSSCENREYFQTCISSKDLLVWAFQVCRGMEYLVSRKVLHGDLAARNILLSDDNVVKICDFGLAKSMNYQATYRKIKDTPLPVKWLAIESLTHRIFSTQSDVWSFGVVLWEFFTLGQTPYPDIEFGEGLFNKLVNGYRMACPKFAPKEIHDLMLECWEAQPKLRPAFSDLVQRIGSMLNESDRQHYLIMNSPYEIMNAQELENQTDFLTLVTEPNYENITSPNFYVDLLNPSQNIN